MEPARKQAGFFIGKIAGKTKKEFTKKTEKNMPCKTDFYLQGL